MLEVAENPLQFPVVRASFPTCFFKFLSYLYKFSQIELLGLISQGIVHPVADSLLGFQGGKFYRFKMLYSFRRCKHTYPPFFKFFRKLPDKVGNQTLFPLVEIEATVVEVKCKDLSLHAAYPVRKFFRDQGIAFPAFFRETEFEVFTQVYMPEQGREIIFIDMCRVISVS